MAIGQAVLAPAVLDVAAVRRRGRRFAAQLAYNRAGLVRSRIQRLGAAYKVLRLFEYRYWPTHRSKTMRLLRRAAAYARRRAEKIFNRTLIATGQDRAVQ